MASEEAKRDKTLRSRMAKYEAAKVRFALEYRQKVRREPYKAHLNYDVLDAIRDELKQMGWHIHPDGSAVKGKHTTKV